jgi:hypothetical protein
MNHRGSRECDILGRRRRMYLDGWTRIGDLARWKNAHYETPWWPKIVIKEYARRDGGEALFRQTKAKGVTKNYWIATWALHVVHGQAEAADVPTNEAQAKDYTERSIDVLRLTAQNMGTVPEDWKRPDAIWPYLNLNVALDKTIRTDVLARAFWDQEWFRAWQPLPEWRPDMVERHTLTGMIMTDDGKGWRRP